MGDLRVPIALLCLLAVDLWNRLVARGVTRGGQSEADDPDVVEHERNWYDYLRGFHAHHGDADGGHPEHGSFWTGLVLWYETRCLRGYTHGDDVYLCPNVPRSSGFTRRATRRRLGLPSSRSGRNDVRMVAWMTSRSGRST